ncbi:MAG: MHYT domain-containing protein [Pseudomonadota bacterium]
MLVIASVLVSIMASYTGLTLTRGISELPDRQRKFMIVLAAMALGGGIWSMHFVAMLAMSFPIPISYGAAHTLGSALIAVLMCGIAFLILHYSGRSWIHIIVAGTILGNGIVAMHYVGMSGIRGCLPIFSPIGIVLAIVGATITGIIALRVSYAARSTQRILAGAVIFGLSVVFVHFVAMYWTQFEAILVRVPATPILDNGTLALLVMLSAFVICGMFLLTSANFVFANKGDIPTGINEPSASGDSLMKAALVKNDQNELQASPEMLRLPFERDKKTFFIACDQIVAIRADGHYTQLYTKDEKLFCPLSISDAETRLPPDIFLRTHRSYLVNINAIVSFERHKDNGMCQFDGVTSLKGAPVSRSYVPVVKERLGI